MKDEKSCCTKLSVCNLAVACGVTWGLATMVLTYMALWFNIGEPLVELTKSLYIGLEVSVKGGLIGLFWGFVDGFIMGGLIAVVYNYARCKCPCSTCKKCRK